MNMVEIEAQVIEVLGRADAWLPDNQLAELRELARSGEARTALEIVCIELFAFGVPVPTDLWERLRHLNRELGIAGVTLHPERCDNADRAGLVVAAAEPS